MQKRSYLFVISFLIIAGLLYFSNFDEIIVTIKNANPPIIIGTFFLWIFNSSVRSLRWQRLLKNIDVNISFPETWNIFMASMFISNLSPAKTGDPMRSVILKRNTGESFSKTVCSIFVERLMDVIFLVIVMFIFTPVFLVVLNGIGFWISITLIFYVFIIIFGLFIITSVKRSEIFFTKLFGLFSFIPKIKSYESRIKKGAKKLNKAFKKYSNKKSLIIPFLLTSIIWIVQGFVVYLSFMSVGIIVPIWACIAVIPLTVLIGVLTFLPGALGSTEVIMVTFFTGLFYFSLPEVTAAVLISRAILYWPYVITGAVLFSLKFK